MFSVLFVLGPGLSAQILPDDLEPAGAPESGFTLGQNYPNPFNPETRIPFELHEALFSDGGTVVVSMRILNILLQPASTPTALNHPSGQAPLVDLEYTSPGQYVAYWSVLDQYCGAVASGAFFIILSVNGAPTVGRMCMA